MKIIIVIITLIAWQTLYADEIIEISSRPQVTQTYLYLQNDKASANLILFAGGNGKLEFTDDWLKKKGFNFLVRSRHLFRDQGFNIAIINAPSDRRSRDGMLFGFRTGKEHVTDIAAVIADLKKRNTLPVWLVGTSRGTESAAWAATQLSNIDGVVLTASITRSTQKGTDLTELPLANIRVPVLLVSHKDDDCEVTEPGNNKYIARELKNAPRVKIFIAEGGKEPVTSACKARSAHGFYGIENDVVLRITRFIKETS